MLLKKNWREAMVVDERIREVHRQELNRWLNKYAQAIRVDAVVAGFGDPAPLPGGLVRSRLRRGARACDDAGARGHRLCVCIGPAWHLRALCDHHAAAGLRRVRAKPHPGPGAGFVACRHHTRRRRSAIGWRPLARRGARRHDGDCLGHHLHPGGSCQARLRYRAALEAHPLRLYERHRAYRVDQPIAQAVRLIDRRRRTVARSLGYR